MSIEVIPPDFTTYEVRFRCPGHRWSTPVVKQTGDEAKALVAAILDNSMDEYAFVQIEVLRRAHYAK